MLDPIYKLLGLNNQSNLAQYLVKGSSVSFIIQVFFIGITFIATALVTNFAGSSEYGRYTAVMAWLNILVVFALCGNMPLAVREVAKYQAADDKETVKSLWQHSFWRVLLFSLVVGIIAWFSLNAAGIINENNESLFKMALVALPIWAVANLVSAFLRGAKHVILSQVPDKIFRSIGFFVLIILAWLFLDKIEAEQIFQIQILLLSVVLISSFYFLNKNEGWIFNKASENKYVKAWSAMGMVFLFQSAMQVGNGRVDILTLDYYRTDSEVGIYGVALKIADLLKIVLMIVNIVIAPEIAALYNSGKTKKLQQLLKRSIQISFFLSLPIALFLILAGTQVLGIFGEDFSSGYPVLVFIIFIQLINVGVGSVGNVLNMTGHEKEASLGLFISMVLNVCLNLMLVPLYGMMGAAIASGVAIVSWNLIMWVMVKKKLGINTSVINFK